MQDLLNLCQSSVRPEQRLESGITKEWYRSCKAANVRPAIYDLLCQPLKTLQNGDSFTYINAGTDTAETAKKGLIGSSYIVKEGTLLISC